MRIYGLLFAASFFALASTSCAEQEPQRENDAEQKALPEAATPWENATVELFVSGKGSDANDGSMESPFASLERARDAIRALKAERDYPEGGIVITLREGIYRRERTFALTARDSGTKEAPIVYRAFEGETVTFIGGIEFPYKDLERVTDSGVRQRIGQAADQVLMLDLRAYGISDYGELPLYGHGMNSLSAMTHYKRGAKAPELFMGTEPLTLARWPNEGFAQVGRVVEVGDVVRAWMDDAKGSKAMDHKYVPVEERNDPPLGFAFVLDDERVRRWGQVEDMWVYGYWFYNWSDQSAQVASVDTQKGIIRSVQPSAYGVKTGQRFYVYNLLEELDQPGEWYLDRAKGVLYLIPPYDAPQSTLFLSLLTEPLVKTENTSHVIFRGIEFSCTRGDGVRIHGGRGMQLQDCRIANTGNRGLHIEGGHEHSVEGSHLFNIGTTGIVLSGGNINRLEGAGHRAENNLIHNFGRIEKTYNPAISLQGVGSIARNNEVHHSAHLGIGFSGNNHLIEFNYIHDVARETDDMAAIYAGRSWTARGTVIRYNLVRNVTGYQTPKSTHRVSGVYLDDGLSETTVSGNIFINVAQGLMFNGGRDNIATNNLFIDVDNMMRATDMRKAFTTWAAMSWKTLNENLKNTPVDREPWLSSYPQLKALAQDEPDTPKYNTITGNLRYQTPLVMGERGITDGVVEYGEVADNPELSRRPGYFDEHNGRFVFDPSSGVFDVMPALSNIPVERIGRKP